MANGEWRMANGEWRMADGGWRMAKVRPSARQKTPPRRGFFAPRPSLVTGHWSLTLGPPGRAARSPRRTQRAQHIVDGAQLHPLHRRGRAFLVRNHGTETGLVDDHAAEFILHDDGAGVRPFRLQQRHSGGRIHRLPVLFLPLGYFGFDLCAANSDRG